jgi:4-hydroxyacetophenone monooxygenase
LNDPIPTSTDDSSIAEALECASLPALIPALVHMTGDTSLLDRYAPRVPGRDVAGAAMGDEEAREVRALALETLKAIRDGSHAPPPPLSDATLCRLMSWCAGEEVPSDYLPLAVEESRFDGRDSRGLEWSRPPAADVVERFRVGIIGAGLGGLCAAIRLEQAGIPYTVIEKNHAVGGTWLENDYPDLRVDVPNHFYSYSFEPNPDWSDFYARRSELEAYIEDCATKYGVRRNIRFETEVTRATWDDDDDRWILELQGADGGTDRLETNVVINATGMLNRPFVPEIPGLKTFQGPCFHSSHWDQELDLSGQRVAVIGTGASAMQIVPGIADEVERLLVFQRSRHWALPNENYHKEVSDGKKWLLRYMPFYAGWYRFLLFWNSSDRMYSAFCIDADWEKPEISISLPNDILRRAMTEHMREQLGDAPELFEKVLPDYPPLGKRILQDNGWYRTLTRENVDLVTEPIEEITADAVVTRDGSKHPIDVLVLATGFHASRFLWPIEFRGRGGVMLHELWGDDPRAHLGITIPGFPNLFCLYGPNTNPVVGSVIFMLECQVRYVMGCVREMLEGNIASMECRQDVHDEYNERVDAEHEKMVWRHPRVHSYYNNDKGRVVTNAPWRLLDYWKMTKSPDLGDFSLRETIGSAVPKSREKERR